MLHNINITRFITGMLLSILILSAHSLGLTLPISKTQTGSSSNVLTKKNPTVGIECPVERACTSEVRPKAKIRQEIVLYGEGFVPRNPELLSQYPIILEMKVDKLINYIDPVSSQKISKAINWVLQQDHSDVGSPWILKQLVENCGFEMLFDKIVELYDKALPVLTSYSLDILVYHPSYKTNMSYETSMRLVTINTRSTRED